VNGKGWAHCCCCRRRAGWGLVWWCAQLLQRCWRVQQNVRSKSIEEAKPVPQWCRPLNAHGLLMAKQAMHTWLDGGKVRSAMQASGAQLKVPACSAHLLIVGEEADVAPTALPHSTHDSPVPAAHSTTASVYNHVGFCNPQACEEPGKRRHQ
jgi:hypothetical protein